MSRQSPFLLHANPDPSLAPHELRCKTNWACCDPLSWFGDWNPSHPLSTSPAHPPSSPSPAPSPAQPQWNGNVGAVANRRGRFQSLPQSCICQTALKALGTWVWVRKSCFCPARALLPRFHLLWVFQGPGRSDPPGQEVLGRAGPSPVVHGGLFPQRWQ